ncbi:MAG: sorbosone dehydrogenase family protein [Acidobacteriota bacterium]
MLVVVFLSWAAVSAFAPSEILLEPVASGFESPVLVTDAGDGSGRLFVVEQRGRIRVVRSGELLPQPYLDITATVESGGEKGLLGLAFHPDFAQNRRFFVNYTTRVAGRLKTIIAEYQASMANSDLAEPSERILLEIDQPFDNHNGGHLAFGPDGFLYVGTGDGGSAGDPMGNAQNLGSLLGKILRLDVNAGTPYGIPVDNPFPATPGARPEIWAYGLRNPWRFSFDRTTGRLFAGDVGQNAREEVDIIARGGNYGWNITEGTACYPPSMSSCSRAGLIGPIADYGRDEGSSVTGGFVYRGRALRRALEGSYIFGDFGSGIIWRLFETEDGQWEREELLRAGFNVSSFGEDERGELYVVDYSGIVNQLRPGRVSLGRRPRNASTGIVRQ